MSIDIDDTADKLPTFLRQLRKDRGMSQLHLADTAGVNVSVVNKAERGRDARLSTWNKLFLGLGYRLAIAAVEVAEECEDMFAEEIEARRQRRVDGLCTGKRRFG